MTLRNQTIRFLSKKEIKALTNKSDVTIWRWVKNGIFPAPVYLGPNSIAWTENTYNEWAKDPEAWAEKHRKGGAA